MRQHAADLRQLDDRGITGRVLDARLGRDVELRAVVEDAADEWVHRAMAKEIDLGFELSDAQTPGDALLLYPWWAERARLFDLERARVDDARAAERKSQVGSGDRSERIRTYNFPQGRLTDHRINLTLYKLDRVMDGELDDVVEALRAARAAEQLAALGG